MIQHEDFDLHQIYLLVQIWQWSLYIYTMSLQRLLTFHIKKVSVCATEANDFLLLMLKRQSFK